MLLKEIISFKTYRDYSFIKITLFLLAPLLLSLGMGLTYGFLYVEDPFALLRQLYPDFTTCIQFLTDYGSSPLHVIYIYLVLNAIVHKKKEQGIFCIRGLIVIFITLALVIILKNALGIPRPGYDFPTQPWSGLWQYQAIPSGHTVEIIALSLPLALWVYSKNNFIILTLLATTVCFSRIWLGVHHPLDVVVGIFLGLITALLAITSNSANDKRKKII